jgi:hypothetical protein
MPSINLSNAYEIAEKVPFLTRKNFHERKT